MSIVQDFYPEMIHQAVSRGLNASIFWRWRC